MIFTSYCTNFVNKYEKEFHRWNEWNIFTGFSPIHRLRIPNPILNSYTRAFSDLAQRNSNFFRCLNELDKRSLLSKNLDMVCNVRMALRLDPDTGMITIRGRSDDSRVISLRLASSEQRLFCPQSKIHCVPGFLKCECTVQTVYWVTGYRVNPDLG